MHRIAAVLAGLTVAAAASAKTLLVPSDFATIQGAVDAASNGDLVLVAPGTYGETVRSRGKAFTLRGMAGAAATVIDGLGLGSVVEFVDAPGMVTLDGLTIQGGLGDCRGGGVRVTGSSVTILRSVIQDNLAFCALPGDGDRSGGHGFGGGVYCDQDAVLMDCVVRDNIARGHPPTGNFTGADGHGGGIYAEQHLWLTSCLVEGNVAQNIGCGGSTGGGVAAVVVEAQDSEVRQNWTTGGSCAGTTYGKGAGIVAETAWLTRCRVHHNSNTAPTGWGGGLWAATAYVHRCTFQENHGGGLKFGAGEELQASYGEVSDTLVTTSGETKFTAISLGQGHLVNTTIVHVGGCASLVEIGGASSTVVNSIVWSACGDGVTLLLFEGLAQNSLVRGGFPGSDMIEGDPMFVNPGAGDYRLASGSPCIDAGADVPPSLLALDLDGNPRFLFGACLAEEATGQAPVDVGCLEHVHADVPLADLDGDCHVGRLDLEALLTAWLAAEISAADLNGDGAVDIEDLGLLLAHWTE